MKVFLKIVWVMSAWCCIMIPLAINFGQVKFNQKIIIQKLDCIQQECINIHNNKPIIHCNCSDSNKTDTITKYIYIK